MNYNHNFGQHENYIHGHLQKKRIIDFFNISEIENFVETGTYKGSGVQWAVDSKFKNIFSTEIHNGLYTESKNRFESFDNVQIFNSDTIHFLKNILPTINSKTLFYLDAHISGEDSSHNPNYPVPLIEESKEIINLFYDINECIIVIDDERLWSDILIGNLINLFESLGLTSIYLDDSIIFCNKKYLIK